MSLTLDEWNTILQIAVSVVTLIGGPIAVWMFFRDRHREHQARVNEIYLRSSDRYANFLTLMLSHTDTGVYIHGENETVLTEADKRRSILFEIVTQMFEDAFFVYRNSTSAQRQRQWAGWQSFIEAYCDLPEFLTWWEQRVGDVNTFKPGASSYDLDFENVMVQALRRAKQSRMAATVTA